MTASIFEYLSSPVQNAVRRFLTDLVAPCGSSDITMPDLGSVDETSGEFFGGKFIENDLSPAEVEQFDGPLDFFTDQIRRLTDAGLSYDLAAAVIRHAMPGGDAIDPRQADKTPTPWDFHRPRLLRAAAPVAARHAKDGVDAAVGTNSADMLILAMMDEPLAQIGRRFGRDYRTVEKIVVRAAVALLAHYREVDGRPPFVNWPAPKAGKVDPEAWKKAAAGAEIVERSARAAPSMVQPTVSAINYPFVADIHDAIGALLPEPNMPLAYRLNWQPRCLCRPTPDRFGLRCVPGSVHRLLANKMVDRIVQETDLRIRTFGSLARALNPARRGIRVRRLPEWNSPSARPAGTI